MTVPEIPAPVEFNSPDEAPVTERPDSPSVTARENTDAPEVQSPLPRTTDRSWKFFLLAAGVVLLAVTFPVFRYIYDFQLHHYHNATDFAPPCNISCREVQSAVKRAKTEFCKVELMKFGCALQKESVYPGNLKNLCPTEKPVIPSADSPTTPSKRVRILFVLTIHGRDSRQVRRLLQLIYHVDHYFLIHVDQRSEFLFRDLLPLEKSLSNVKLMRRRHSPIWGGASLLTTLLDAMQFGLSEAGWADWDYFLNLSESDLPIKTNDELVEYLTKNYGRNFVKSHGTSAERFVKRQGLDKTFFECENHMWRVGLRQLPSGITIDGGSDWIVLHRGFCQYLLDDAESELLSGLRTVFNHTLLPAESFFHTVLRNSRFCHTYSNNNLRLTNWQRKKGCNCQYDHIVDWCGCSPNVFRVGDSKTILSYSPKPIFFARKFEPIVDLRVINVILADLRASSGSEERGLRLSEIPPTWRRHWLNLFSTGETCPSVSVEVLLHSLTRISASSRLSSASKAESPGDAAGKVLSSHLMVDLQGNRAILLAQELSFRSGRQVVAEFLIRFKSHFQLENQAGAEDSPAGRIKDLQISTDFDKKELIFRNYLNVLGPRSEPALAYTAAAGESVLLSVVWLDPADVVAGSFELNVTADADVGTQKPEFRNPLRPGIWTVYVMHDWKVVARTKFLILPSNSPVENSGPHGNSYIDYNFTSVSRLFPSLRPVARKLEADRNGQKIEKDLAAWTDTLVEAFYTVEEACLTDRQSAATENVQFCLDTPWSSYFPDDSLNIETFPVLRDSGAQ